MYNGSALLPYQVEGRDFLTRPNPGGSKNHKYLAWEPGLGKSCIISAALVDSGVETLLLICPVRVKQTWMKHLLNWGVVESENDVQILWQTTDVVKPRRVIIVSFELLLSPFIQEQLKRRTYDAIVVDEAHRAKTLTSKRSNILFGKDALIGYGRLKWLASGTPMPNGTANELYPPIACLFPECIDRIDYETFLLRYCGAYATFNGYGSEIHLGTDNDIDRLKKQFNGFISFKTISEVAHDLPPIIEKDVYLNIGSIGADHHDTPLSTLARLIGEAKVAQAAQYINDWKDEHNGQRLLIFAFHREVITTLAQLTDSSYLFGGQSDAVKQSILNRFCRRENYDTSLILQINAAGEAIDGLQHAANHIINVEPNWTAGTVNQAYGRLYRIGQTKPVYVTTLVAENTLDETKIYKCTKKQGIIDQYFDAQITQTTTENKRMPSDEQWDDIIDIADRFVSIFERMHEGNGEPEKPKQTRNRKKKDDVQTQNAPPPVAPSAPLAAVGANVVTMPQQPQPTDLPANFQQVIDVAKAAKVRITQQFKNSHPELTEDQATEKAMAFLSTTVIKPLGYNALPEAENAEPQKWLLIMQSLSQKQYVPDLVTSGNGVGF